MFGAEACLLVAVLGFAAQAAIIWTSPAVDLLRQPAMDEIRGRDADPEANYPTAASIASMSSSERPK